MFKCCNCKQDIGFLSSHNSVNCSQQDCNMRECGKCQSKINSNINLCGSCGHKFCQIHFDKKIHECIEDGDINIENENMEENEAIITYYGNNKEFVIIDTGMLDDLESNFVQVLALEEKGYKFMAIDGCYYIMRKGV